MPRTILRDARGNRPCSHHSATAAMEYSTHLDPSGIALRFLLLICPLLTGAANAAVAPEITNISASTGDRIVISGKHFGARCPHCEVLARYSRQLTYSLPVERWSPERITARLPDLNQNNLAVNLRVKTRNGSTPQRPFRIRRQEKLQSTLLRQHMLRVGDKGEDVFKIPGGKLACNKPTALFNRSELRIVERRFADASIIKRPSPGCEQCSPVVVRWYNEPTGRLKYELRIYTRTVEGICTDRLRHGT